MTKMTMEDFKKFCGFVAVLIAVFAIVGGTAYLFYDHHYPFAFANLCLGAMAVPYIVEKVKELLK